MQQGAEMSCTGPEMGSGVNVSFGRRVSGKGVGKKRPGQGGELSKNMVSAGD